MRILKFLITGAIGISINLGIFHMLYIFGTPYLIGSVIGTLTSIIIGFLLQKYWTFEDYSPERAHAQFILYTTLASVNLVLNTGIVYVLVSRFDVFYLFAQAIGAAIIAIYSFLIYRGFIFKTQ